MFFGVQKNKLWRTVSMQTIHFKLTEGVVEFVLGRRNEAEGGGHPGQGREQLVMQGIH